MKDSSLLEKFEELEELDKQLKKEYFKCPPNERKEIFENYALISKYEEFELRLEGAPPSRERKQLEDEISKRYLNPYKKPPIITLIEDIALIRKRIVTTLFWRENEATNNMAAFIKRFNSNRYFYDKVYREYAREIDTNSHLSFEVTVDVFHTLFDTTDFGKRIMKIGSWVVLKPIPNEIRHHIRNLKNCYAHGQFEASIIYCRTLLELSGFDYLKRQKIIKYNANKYAWKIGNILDILFINREIYNKINDIKKAANKILHGTTINEEINEQNAYEAIKTTIEFIEYLYTH